MGMSDSMWAALALVLVVEGVLPFVSPQAWRELFRRAVQMSDGQIRFLGLTSLLLGLFWLLLLTA
jgi:uncharacterized protein YjeT (DUF2065 family)